MSRPNEGPAGGRPAGTQIIDHVGALRRNWWLLVLVPVLTVLAAVAIQLQQPQEYRTTATVTLGGVADHPAQQDQLISDFEELVGSPVVTERVARSGDVEPLRAADAIGASRRAGSSLVTVEYTTRSGDAAASKALVETSITQALQYLLAPEVESTETRIEAAEVSFVAAEKAIEELVEETGLALPDEDYRSLSSQLAQLRVRAQERRAEGAAEAAESLEASADALAERLRELGQAVAEYARLQERKNDAEETLLAARQESTVLRTGRVDPIAAGSRTTVVGTSQPVRTPGVIAQRSAVALAVSLALTVGILLVLEVPPRRQLDGGTAP